MYLFICEDSPDGILTGVYDAWSYKIANHIKTHDEIGLLSAEPYSRRLFCEYIPVTVSSEKAAKVRHTICKNLGAEFYEEILNATLASDPCGKNQMDKADAIYKTIVIALSSPDGAKVLNYLNEPCIHRVFTLSRAAFNESHHLTGFVRFTELENGVLFSVIHPKNNALPHLAEHFTDRFPMENFIIYDENRKIAAIHSAGKNFLLADASDLNQSLLRRYSEKEEAFQKLWLAFFENIAIKARINPKLQAQNVPKRFWKDMTELKDRL